MGIVSKLLKRRKNRAEELTFLAKDMGRALDDLARGIFAEHQAELIARPITYVVPGVWGAQKNGRLSSTQARIHQKTAPVIQELMDRLDTQNLDDPRRFAISYLLRSLVISKLTYLIEAGRERLLRDSAPDLFNLASMEPQGNA